MCTELKCTVKGGRSTFGQGKKKILPALICIDIVHIIQIPEEFNCKIWGCSIITAVNHILLQMGS